MIKRQIKHLQHLGVLLTIIQDLHLTQVQNHVSTVVIQNVEYLTPRTESLLVLLIWT